MSEIVDYEEYDVDADDVILEGDPNLDLYVPPSPTPGGGTDLDDLDDSTNGIDDSDLIVSKENGGDWVKKTASKAWDYMKSKLGIGTTADGTYLNKAGQWSTPPNTTYNVVSKNADGLAPQLPDETTTTKYLRQDGSWNVPPNTWPDANTYKTQFLNYAYPVGSIYVSTKNVSPATFLGGTWISLSGYMLRGATSGVTANSNAKDGGSDTVTLTGAQSGIQKHSHGFTQPTVNGGATTTGGGGSHNHYVSFNGNGTTENTSYAVGRYSVNSDLTYSFRTVNSTANYGVTSTHSNHTHSQVAHTHTVSGGAVSEKAATNATSSFSNIPNYKNVYMWERTA